MEGIIKNIEQAHQVTTANRNPSATSSPPSLVAKITNWDISEKINSVIIEANDEGKSVILSLTDVLKVSDGKKKCHFEVLSRSQKARPANPRLCKIPRHTNDLMCCTKKI